MPHFGAEFVRTALGDRVDQETTGTVESDRLRTALDNRNLRDVMRGWLTRQHTKERQRYVDTVKLVGVVLARATSAGSAHGEFRVLHARDELHQVTIFLAHRNRINRFGADQVLERPLPGFGQELRTLDDDLFDLRARHHVKLSRLLQLHVDGALLHAAIGKLEFE